MNAPIQHSHLADTACPICDQPEPCRCGPPTNTRPSPSILPRRGITRPKVDGHVWAPVNYTRFECNDEHTASFVRKRATLAKDGALVLKPAEKHFWNGRAIREQRTLGQFGQELQAAPPSKEHAFYSAGVSKESEPGKPLPMGSFEKGKKRSRSKEEFPFPEQNALLVIDSDSLHKWPEIQTPEDLVDVIAQIEPALDADCVTSTSGSSFIEGPRDKRGLRGNHTFYPIDKGAEIPRVLEALHVRAWLAGYGCILVTQNGCMLPRSIVDVALASPNQPIYEFGAVLQHKAITQHRQVNPHLSLSRQKQIQADKVGPLTEAERAEYARLVETAKAAMRGEAERVTAAWLDQKTDKLPPEKREAAQAALLEQRDSAHRDLAPDFPITLDDGRVLLVRELLEQAKASPDTWHKMSIPDPFEPEYGKSKATVFTKDQRDGRVRILSFAHGGSGDGQPVVYFLEPRPDARPAFDSGLFEEAGVVLEGRELFDKQGNKLALFPNPPSSERPCYRVLDDWTQIPAGEPSEMSPDPKPLLYKPGLWQFEVKRSKEGSYDIETWICGPLHIEAQTRDGSDNNFGRLLRFKTSAGSWRTWALPMEALGGTAAGVTQILYGMGLITSGTIESKQKIIEFLASSMPDRIIRCVPQIGWTDDTFVLPDAIVGPAAADIVLQSPYIAELNEMHGTAGSFDGWRAGVADVAVGNDWLVLGLSAAFAGPLLKRTGSGSGGIHFMGNSSTGKTTILDAACSVWGGSEYKRTWLTTSNGLEGVAAMSNDCLLALDEISQCEPQQIGNVIYMLGNGVGKQRANRNGAARTPTRHKTVVISTGEKTIADAMLEGGKRVKAGQGVRLIDVRVSGRHGCFDELHGHATGKHFVDAIAAAASSHYGHAGRRFLEALVKDEQDLVARLAEIRKLPEFNPEHADGQRERVASRFALFALAGELASEYGVTGWASGTATQAAAMAFASWHKPRGQGSTERQQALTSILAFLERHGDSRFSDSKKPEGAGLVVRDRAGWFRDVKVGGGQEIEREYLFHSEGLREALAGADLNGAIRALVDAGVLPPPDEKGKHAKVVKIGGTATRVYPILPRKVQAALDGERDDVEVREYDPFEDE